MIQPVKTSLQFFLTKVCVFSTMVTVILWLLYQQAKSLQYSLEWETPYKLENLKVPSLKPGMLFLLLWHGQCVSYKAENSLHKVF